MNLSTIKEGMHVVAKQSTDYAGLIGEIQEIKQIDGGYQYTLSFLKTEKMNTTHPHLNFKRIDRVVLLENQVIFFPDTWLNKGYDHEGNAYSFDDVVCSHPTYMSRVMDTYIPY